MTKLYLFFDFRLFKKIFLIVKYLLLISFLKIDLEGSSPVRFFFLNLYFENKCFNKIPPPLPISKTLLFLFR